MFNGQLSKYLVVPLLALAGLFVGCASSETTVCKETGRICPSGTQCVAGGNACALSSCGNGVVELGELCDDGANEDGDSIGGTHCSADCRSDESCGNGVLDERVGEVCDVALQDTGKCSVDCRSDLTCGNGIWDKDETSEECDGDDGPPGTACLDCRIVSCGNGRVDGEEECDHAEEGETQCTLLCKRPACGDGVVSHGEVCDHKNDETCREDCKGKIGCGNGEPDGDEECDDGNLRAGDECGPTCLVEGCGNGFVDPGEVCDGELAPGGPCSPDCLSDLTCGNGIKDPGEVCDYASKVNGTRCNDDCSLLDGCGNGVIEDGEQCDPALDGGMESNPRSRNTSNCDEDCTFPVCGDGDTNGEAGEDCDPGKAGSTDLCTSTCKNSFCGDQFTNTKAGEQCDDGIIDTRRCNGPNAGEAACQPVICGDGYRNEIANEDCEPSESPLYNSATGDSPTCNGPNAPLALQCRNADCGDLYTNKAAGEECDSGDQDSSRCNNGTDAREAGVECKKPVCGDGHINQAAGEECEPSSPNGSGDSTRCNGPNAAEVACLPATCGDGYANRAAGECGDTVNDTDNCNGSKAGSGSGCKTKTCGDGYKHDDEACDSGHVDTEDCNGAQCTLPACGDGHVNRAAGELCDPGTTPNDVNGDGDSPTCNGQRAAARACQPAMCGDGYTNKAAGECGDQAADSNACNSNRAGGGVACLAKACGDAYKHKDEQCDSGGTDSATCNGSTCLTSRCGDGHINRQSNEQCEPGQGGEGVNAAGDSASCNGPNAGSVSCRFSQCGDNYTNTEALTGTDENGAEATEACDNGALDSEACNGSNGSASKCQTPKCGDARVNRADGEQCDVHSSSDPDTWQRLYDGEIVDPDSCNAVEAGSLACKRAVCGDGFTNVANEECDPGNDNDENHAVCNTSDAGGDACTIGVCGDGHVSGPEECDPGNGGADSIECNGRDAGPVACKRRKCGDFYINRAFEAQTGPEECDVGPNTNSTCISCKLSFCGDGVVNVQAGEDCDRLNNNWPRYCIHEGAPNDAPEALHCHNSYCGDGFLNSLYESCDDVHGDFKQWCPSDCRDAGP